MRARRHAIFDPALAFKIPGDPRPATVTQSSIIGIITEQLLRGDL
jgi:hypothetical protein